jgi:hypothetical protein
MGRIKPVNLLFGLFIIAVLLVTGCDNIPTVTAIPSSTVPATTGPEPTVTYSGWPTLINGDKGFVHSDGVVTGAGVQVLPYIAGNNLVMQILNYNYVNDKFVILKNLLVSVRMPDGLTAMNKTLKLISPDVKTEITLEYTIEGDWLKFTVPELNSWAVAELE